MLLTRRCTVLLVCVGGALTLGVAALFAASAPSFAAASRYATGDGPRSVAIGDLNGDGTPDLVTANAYSHTVSVLLNKGDGSFLVKRDYPTEDAPVSVAIGDLNGDGKPELATANSEPNTVSVLLNRGDGSFQAKLDYTTALRPWSVAIGDLNGDGKPDLATANLWADTVSVLLNKGDGSFQAKLDYATGDGPRSVTLGDLNGDGNPDLATANGGTSPDYHEDTVSVLLNKGDGSFQAKLDYGTGRETSSVALGDLNGDGNLDLATANVRGTASVLLNKGDGSFQAKLDYGAGPAPISIAIGDLNGDRKPDLATGNYGTKDSIIETTVSVLANRGDGSFETKLNYRTGPDPRSVAIGDLNGDRRPDLATANFAALLASGTVSVLLNTPGLCTVQDVGGRTLPAAKRGIARANCRVGRIRRAYSKTNKPGHVISQIPKPGRVLPNRGKVNLVVSRGRRPS